MNPYIVELGKFHIRWYSVLILIAVLISFLMLSKEMKRYKANGEFLTNLAFWTIITGIIGARIYYVAFNWDFYSKNPIDIIKIWNGGIAIHGALFAGLITIIIYCKKRRAKALLTLDTIAPCVLLAQAIGRWGNFFNSEAFGSITTLEHLKSLKIIPNFVIKGMFIDGNYYLPTFYFESLYCLIGVIIILIIRRRRYTKNGQIFGFYLMWYSLGRFFIEKYRMDSLMLGNFKVAQLVSVVLFIIGLAVIIYQGNKPKLEELYNSKQTIETDVYADLQQQAKEAEEKANEQNGGN